MFSSISKKPQLVKKKIKKKKKKKKIIIKKKKKRETPAGIYLFKVINGNTRVIREIFSKLTIRATE